MSEVISSTDFSSKVLEAPGKVLVDFFATWCGPCRMLAPVLDEVAAENPAVKVYKVDIDQSPDVAARYGVTSVPPSSCSRTARWPSRPSAPSPSRTSWPC